MEVASEGIALHQSKPKTPAQGEKYFEEWMLSALLSKKAAVSTSKKAG